MPHTMEIEANDYVLEAKYLEYKHSAEQRKHVLDEVTILIKGGIPDVLMHFLETSTYYKHPIFLNSILREIILAGSFTSEQKLECVRKLMQNQELLDFMRQFPKNVSLRGQVEDVDYEPASQAALSDPAILKLFIDIDNGQTVIKGCLAKAAEDKQIDALKLILDKCTTPDEIESTYNSLFEKYQEKQKQTNKLQHMQRFIDNNLDRMEGKPIVITSDDEMQAMEAEYAKIFNAKESYHAQALVFEQKFAEAKQYLLDQKNDEDCPWSKYEYVYVLMFRSIVARDIKNETENLWDFIRFLFADRKFADLFKAWDIERFKDPLFQMIINNSMQVLQLLIDLDNGETVARLDPLDRAITHVNVPMFEMLMQNPIIVAKADKDAILSSLNNRLQYYGGDLELQRQVLDLLDTKRVVLLANGSVFGRVRTWATNAAKRMNMQ